MTAAAIRRRMMVIIMGTTHFRVVAWWGWVEVGFVEVTDVITRLG